MLLIIVEDLSFHLKALAMEASKKFRVTVGGPSVVCSNELGEDSRLPTTHI